MYTALIGTAKGLIIYQINNNQAPQLSGIQFTGFSVNMVYVDERSNRWWAGVSHKHWGQKLHFSDDEGKSWQETPLPTFEGEEMPNGAKARLRQIWSMSHAGKDRPDELWLGTDPGGLFHSKDNGATFQLVKSLWDHPSREKEGQWFGAGSDYPFIHSIVVDPKNNDHVYIAVSCAGVFKSIDGGATWHAKNKGLVATYLPNPNVEVGHDPHLLLMSPADSSILWQQNHCGIFYSKNGGEEWIDVSVRSGIPNYGFCMAIDEKDPAKAWVIPVESDEQRIAPNLKLQVYHTDNFGEKWSLDSKGLDSKHSFDIVLRQSFIKKESLFIFGTNNGNIYYRNELNDQWKEVTSNLTKVNAVFVW